VKRARLRYHVLSSYATNLAFYLALRTDPEAAGVDVRAHAVIAEIVRLRKLRMACEGFGLEEKGERKGNGKNGMKGKNGEVGAEEGEESGEGAPEVLPSIADVMVDGAEGEGEGREGEPVKEKKMKKRGKRKRKNVDVDGVEKMSAVADVAAEDEEFMRNVVGEAGAGAVEADDGREDNESAAKRRKLNRVVGALERDRQSKADRRSAPADLQAIRQDPAPPKASRVQPAGADLRGDGGGEDGDDDVEGGSFGSDDDEAFMERMLAKKEKKERKLARKAEDEAPHTYTFDDSIKDKALRRRASAQVVNNRGLTRYRPRDRKTPRAKNREAFSKAVKKRKSVVRDPVAAKPSSYGGEASGINMRARKSSRLADV
jgi:U3 small nucleolar RNA-associated protein 3